jgi:hypothetical protein
MSVNMFYVNVLVICITFLQAPASPRSGAPPVLDPSANPEAYEIYAMSLEAYGKQQKDSLLVQQETDAGVPTFLSCGPTFLSKLTGEWAEVARDFQQQNTVERLLQPVLAKNTRYNFIQKAEIEADDARLRQVYPGAWQARPGEIEYVAFSSVGFNQDRTKAILYSHQRLHGGIGKLELKDGKWQWVGENCGWIV